MEIWQRAKTFAEEAAKRSQTLTASSSFKISDIVTETAKRSKDFAAEASKKADEFRAVALKSLSDQIPALVISSHSDSEPETEMEKFGVTDDLREFVKGLTITTFQNFPVRGEDELPVSDVPTFSNVRQDLTEWQQKHATLVLTTVQEISKLRYELCPRLMKEWRFWKIYFTLVSSHVASYEKQYMEEIKKKEAEQMKDPDVKQSPTVGETNKPDLMGTNLKSRTSTSSVADQDLDSFLLGDLEDSDGGPDDDDDDDDDKGFDDDFDKIDSSDVEDEKQVK